MKRITHDRLTCALSYNPDTGTFTWKIRPGKRIRIGATAGRVDSTTGRIRIRIDGGDYLAHRLAWFYVHKEWPSDFLDHIDRNFQNNRIGNLREATHSQNMQNLKIRASSKSGATGVFLRPAKWVALICANKKKLFLGEFTRKKDAIAARKKAERQYFGDFAPLAILLALGLYILFPSSAEARRHHRHYHHRHHHAFYDAGSIIGGRPSGCPHAFCGCGASLYLFGKIIPKLNLAANWLRFPHTSPAPRMAAARSGHVMVLVAPRGGNRWLVHDSNSGGHRTRLHERSISGYVIVNPNA